MRLFAIFAALCLMAGAVSAEPGGKKPQTQFIQSQLPPITRTKVVTAPTHVDIIQACL